MMAAFLMPATSAESGDLLVDVEDVIIAARAYDNGNYQIAIETRTSAVERENTDAMTLLSELHLSGQAGQPGAGKAAYCYPLGRVHRRYSVRNWASVTCYPMATGRNKTFPWEIYDFF